MKKLISKVKSFGAAMIARAKSAVEVCIANTTTAVCCTRTVLADKRGEGFVDTAVKILISVVIGALVLAGLYLLFSDTILPTLTQRIQDMFNYGG